MGFRDRRSTVRSLALRSTLWLVIVVGIVVVAVRYGADRVTGYASVGALVLATSPFAPSLAERWRHMAVPSTAEQVAEAATLLRKLVEDKWRPSAEFLQIGRIDESMGIAWRDVESAASGPISSLIDEYRAAPRPLIVLGDQGSGKTALSILLLLELISRNQAPDARVPVLVRLSSWDPDLDFESWLIGTVYEQYDIYRQLRDTSRFGVDVVSRLMADDRLLPILDGLDELPQKARRSIISQVRSLKSFTAPFVLTSRVAQYESAIDRKPPKGKQTVRLLPMSPASVAGYLRNLFSGDVERWQLVIDDIEGDPDGITAATLSNPLMLYLACTHLYESTTAPTSLLDRASYRTGEELQHYLLDSFVPAVFRTRAAPRTHRNGRQPWQLGSQRAGRVLSVIARYLEGRRDRSSGHGVQDFDWWNLYQQIPRSVVIITPVVIGTLGCGLLGRVGFGLFGQTGVGTAFGLAVGFIGGLVLGAIRPRPPVQFVPRSLRQKTGSRQLLLMDAILGAIGAIAGTVISGVIASPVYGVFSGLIFGLTFALVRRFTRPTEAKHGISPTGALRADRDAVLYSFLLGAFVGAVVGGVIALASPQLAAHLVYKVDSPERGLIGAVVGAVLGGAGLGMVMMATSAWSHFVAARIWLALTDGTPLHLMRFLEDCCELGVLRRLGASYQFRHALLQERLAGSDSSRA
jgi:NACHT domain-containing protein